MQKVQLEEKDLDFIEAVFSIFDYKSKSEYMREAILAKIREDKRKLREMKCRQAMEAYGEEAPENVFESIEAEDFEGR
ncbi:MAG TPA: crotonobetainyl-CoA--carnitine CoA-transferase [Vicinamibacteria bacterium]|nr:crotonobetainyl-CoA--carnitine CoA-transferase [Vicinamibacteria bacterium]